MLVYEQNHVLPLPSLSDTGLTCTQNYTARLIEILLTKKIFAFIKSMVTLSFCILYEY